MGLTASNSRWLTPTPQPVNAPADSEPIPVSAGINLEDETAITHITVYDAGLNISLSGGVASSSVNDFALSPGRYAFMTDPRLMVIQGVGARYQVGYEVGQTDFFLAYWSVFNEWQDTVEESIDLDTSLCVQESSVYVTAISVKGVGVLYVTLDGREASDSDYDFMIQDSGSYGPMDASVFHVAPDKIQVFSSEPSTLKLKYGYFEYPQRENGVYNTPILGRGPFPES